MEDQMSGLLVPFGDVEAHAQAVEKLLCDLPLRTSLGQAARQRAAALFSAETIVPRYEALYHRVCGPR
jgi:glycosyltransferase involved in cell wall biosynthesis